MATPKKKTEKPQKSVTEKQKSAPQEETRDQEPQEKKEEAPAQEKKQEEQKDSEEKVVRESKSERVIVILSKSDSDFLSQFSLPRSSAARGILRGAMEFVAQFATKKDVTEAEIVEALTAKLR